MKNTILNPKLMKKYIFGSQIKKNEIKLSQKC